jgi:hypothetical protein
VSIAAGQATGTFTLAVGVFDITNTNTTGAKLAAGDPSNYQVTVSAPPPSDTTPPVITPNVAGTLGNNGWYTSDVTVSWTVVDHESTVSSTSGCDATIINADTSGTTLTCTAISAGGQSSQSVTIKRDATVPGVTITPDSGPDYGDWYNNLVSFDVEGSDATSGLAGCDSDFSYSTPDSATAQVSASCTDNAGNVGTAFHDFQYDGTLPEVSYSISPVLPAYGWWNIASGAPTATFTCSDATASIESCTEPYTFGEGEDLSFTGNAKDNAGNTASVLVSNIDVDLTAPSVALVGGPAHGSSYYFGSVPASPTCDASDVLSGLAGCNVTGYSTAVGTHTVTASALDNAGNSAIASSTYTVLAWTLNGFYQPVDMGGVFNTV